MDIPQIYMGESPQGAKKFDFSSFDKERVGLKTAGLPINIPVQM